MSITQDLYHFIQSLSQNEKRNFTTAVRRKNEESKNYFKLYKAALKLEEFCLDSLKKYYKKTPSSKECSDLLDKLLLSIKSSSKVRSPQNEIREKVQNAEILYERDLYERSFKLYGRVKKDAYKIEDYPVLMEIIDKQRYVQRYLKVDIQEQLSLQKENENVLKVLSCKSQLDLLWERLLSIPSRKAEEKAKKINDLELELAKISKEALLEHNSSQLKIRLYFIKARIYFHKGNTNQAIKFHQLVIDEYNLKKELKKANVEIYSNHLHGYFSSMLQLNKAKQIDKGLINEFESILEANANTSVTSFENLYAFLCAYHLNLGQFDTFENLIEPIDKGLSKFQNKIKLDFQKVFILNISSFYFLKQDFINCRIWLYKQINHSNKKTRIDYIAMSRVLDCIISVELNEEVENSVRRVNECIKKLNYNNSFLIDAMAFVKKYYKSTPGEKRTLITTFYTHVESIKTSRPPFSSEIESWLRSKINGNSIYENMI